MSAITKAKLIASTNTSHINGGVKTLALTKLTFDDTITVIEAVSILSNTELTDDEIIDRAISSDHDRVARYLIADEDDLN